MGENAPLASSRFFSERKQSYTWAILDSSMKGWYLFNSEGKYFQDYILLVPSGSKRIQKHAIGVHDIRNC
jgi:hypothetical protein